MAILYQSFDNCFVEKIVQVFVPEILNSYQIIKQFLEMTPITSRNSEIFHEINATFLELDEIDQMKCNSQVFSTKSSNSTVYYKNSGTNNEPLLFPVHCVIQKRMQCIPFLCSRSVFLNSNMNKIVTIEEKINENGFLFDYDRKVLSETNFIDEYRVTAYYFKIMCLYFKVLQKLDQNLTYNSFLKFKELLAQKLQQLSAKLEIHENLVNKEVLSIDVNVICLLKDGSTLKLEDYINENKIDPTTFNLTAFLKKNTFFTFEIVVRNILMMNNAQPAMLAIADSFLIFKDKLVNFTAGVEYFEFFETHQQPSKELGNMKELLAKSVLGNRLLSNCGNIKLKMLMSEKLQKFGVKFPFFDVCVSWFEKGFKFSSKKAGNFLLLLDEVVKIRLVKHMNKPMIFLHLHQPKFFKKFARSLLVLECAGPAITDFFYPLCTYLKEASFDIDFEESLPVEVNFDSMINDLDFFKESFASYFRNKHQFGIQDEQKSDELKINQQSQQQRINVDIIVSDDYISQDLLKNFESSLCKEMGQNSAGIYLLTQFEKNDQNEREELIMNNLTNFLKQGDRNPIIKIPSHFDVESIVLFIERIPNVSISNVWAVIDFEKYSSLNYCYFPYNQLLKPGLINCIFILSKINVAEKCDMLVFNLNKIYDSQLIFANGNKSNLHKIVKQERETTKQFSSELQSLKRKAFKSVENNQSFIGQTINCQNPISRKNLTLFYENVFAQNNGVFIQKSSQKTETKPENENNFNSEDIQIEIEKLRAKVSVLNRSNEEEGATLINISGWVRFENELDKVFFVEMNANVCKIIEVRTKILVEVKSFEGQNFSVPKYTDFLLTDFKLLVIAEKVNGVLAEMIVSELVEVF